MIAAKNGHRKTVKTLLRLGSHVNTYAEVRLILHHDTRFKILLINVSNFGRTEKQL